MTRRKKSKTHTPRRNRVLWALGAAGVVFAFLTGLWWGNLTPQPSKLKPPTPKAMPAPKPAIKPQRAAPTEKPTSPKTTPPLPLAALIIDDMGYSLAAAERLAALKMPLTFSILPHASQAMAVALLAQAKGLEVMLHLPMEPRGYPRRNPGPGALLCNMSQERLLEVLREDLEKVPWAVGVNNHMGSSFSLHPQMLEPVLVELKRRGLFYLDSFTSADSQGLATAQALGLRTGRRDVFLDHQASHQAIDQQIERLLKLARERGHAVAIGHPRRETIDALERWAPRLQRQLKLVKVSQLLDSYADSRPGRKPGQ